MPDTCEYEWSYLEKAFSNVGTVTCTSSVSSLFCFLRMNNVYKEFALNCLPETFWPKGSFVN